MCTGRGSNQGPLGPKSDALTTAPLRHHDKHSALVFCFPICKLLDLKQLKCCTAVQVKYYHVSNIQGPMLHAVANNIVITALRPTVDLSHLT